MEPVKPRQGRARKNYDAVPERPAMRPEMREDDPLLAAERRAQEILGNIGGNMDEGVDEFRAPEPPEGWTYEWKMKTVMGMENQAYQTSLARTGWEPVSSKRHPEMMQIGAEGPIERKGMILMERPKIISDQVRDADYKRARSQIRAKEQQLRDAPNGQFGRDHAQAQPKISKSYEPMPVPKDS